MTHDQIKADIDADLAGVRDGYADYRNGQVATPYRHGERYADFPRLWKIYRAAYSEGFYNL